jgi:signal peptidase I
MNTSEIIGLIVAIVCLMSFSAVFTILYGMFSKKNIEEISQGKKDIEILEATLIEKEKKKSRTKKGFKIFGKVLTSVVSVAILVFFVASIYSKISSNILSFGDTSVLVIVTGSMSEKNSANSYLAQNSLNNQFSAGDIILIHKAEQEELSVYDVVAYKNDDTGKIIVHRIRLIKSVDGITRYVTRGDANNVDDSSTGIVFEDVIGVYKDEKAAYIGSFVLFLQSNIGIITILSITYCLFMYDFYDRKYDIKYNDRKDKLIKAIGFDLSNKHRYSSDFDEIIYYKGMKYIFKDGDLLSKSVEKSPIGDEDSLYKIEQSTKAKKGERVDIK